MGKDVLLEIGLEELPARFVDDAEEQLAVKTEKWLDELRIEHGSVTSFSTPRRLAVLVKDVAEEQTSIREEARGPAKKIAIDEDGNWTKAAIGFTKGQGKTVEDIYTKEIKGTTYIFVEKHIEGSETRELLPELRDIITSIQFGKNMRWADETLKYARPIRWIAALYGQEVIPFALTGVQTGNKTFGHRFLGQEITIEKPDSYVDALREQYVIVDSEERERLIRDGISDIEEQKSFQIPIDEDLMKEVRNLVEYPTVFTGAFESQFLELPPEVLITSMKEHQRYFPVKTEEGQLLPYFIGVRNGDDRYLDTVAKGNEKVLRARLSDARFFFEEDQKNSINFYLKKLQRVVFQEKLGTYHDKVERITKITRKLTELLGLGKADAQTAVRAAEICKFDLMTNMVNEFTELQGTIGEKYARSKGEEEAVAQAVGEHYMPKQAHGDLPTTVPGSVVSLADKLDTIVGCIYVGLVPSGSQDPYGLRRQAAGILRILQQNQWDISVESLLGLTQELYQTLDLDLENADNGADELQEFFKLRASFLMKEMGVEQDIVQSVIHKEIGVIDYTFAKAAILSEKRTDESFKVVQEALTRVLNLAGKTAETHVNPDYFASNSEHALYKKLQEIVDPFWRANEGKDGEKAIDLLAELAEPIHSFFDHNMVMAEDQQVKNNRLALVNSIAVLVNEYADLRTIEWKQSF
ncbi:glycine--tRNA ligase subunit beta [Virgibacillus xinjiangensis]|uniref:Glycine--tRNA ligase beta subunit n=1 Tax=Virgibacillus xinjiangensis TaxID=393090 RepID=A0ABV7CS31_9BACI